MPPAASQTTLEVFELTGSFGARPTSGFAPADQAAIVARTLVESLLLKGKQASRYDLTVDGAQTVSLGGLSQAHVIVLESTSRVVVRLTSAEGATQAIPVDGLLVLMSESEAFTAIDLARAAGVETIVQVFLGEKL